MDLFKGITATMLSYTQHCIDMYRYSPKPRGMMLEEMFQNGSWIVLELAKQLNDVGRNVPKIGLG